MEGTGSMSFKSVPPHSSGRWRPGRFVVWGRDTNLLPGRIENLKAGFPTFFDQLLFFCFFPFSFVLFWL